MKTISVLLTVICFISSPVFANDMHKDAEYGEKIYVAYQQNRTVVDASSEELKDLCDPENWLFGGFGPDTAPGLTIVGAARSDLYSVQTKKTDGSILKDDLKKIGSFLGCQSELETVFERLNFPTADLGLVIYLTLNGEQYMVTGSSRLRTDPTQGGIPGPGMFLSGSTGTIHKPFTLADFFNGTIEVVGSLSINSISRPVGEDAFDTSSIFTIRLYDDQAGDGE